MAGDVRNVDRMGGAGLVQIIAGRMALFGKLRIVVVPADNRAASGKGFGLFAQLLNELVHRVYSAVEQRTVQVDLIEVTSTLSREVPMPVNETGQHGLAAQIDNLIDLILIEIPLSLASASEPTKMILPFRVATTSTFFAFLTSLASCTVSVIV